MGLARGLLLDIGGVLIRTPFEMLELAEHREGLRPGVLGPRGPFALDEDSEFADVLAGRLAERAYWARRAERAAPLLGTAPDTRSFMEAIFEFGEEQVVRPQVRDLVHAAQGAGLPVGVLTNDLLDFHGRAWVERMTIFSMVDFHVDGSVTGVLKPDPRAYAAAVEASGLAPHDLLFLDDQPVNVEGARAAGLQAIAFDVTASDEAVSAAYELLGLRPGG